jgi:Zn-dependent peptidase ImmA (M78 family)/transcriptional regulator with XRE-family HTH domain
VRSEAFSPTRLKVARQLAGLKQVDLARKVELTPPALSQYESGAHTPSPAGVQRIALALGVPPDFFFSEINPPMPSPAFFRSLRSTPQMERDRAGAFAWIVARVAEVVEHYVRMPRCDLRLHFELAPTPSRDEIEEAAAAARAAWRVPSGPVANVVRLLEAHGAVTATFRDGHERLSAFSQWHGHRPIVVFCSRRQERARRRFDAAHELGHLALHSEPEPGNHALERHADEFASAFLMPAEDIAPFLPSTRIDWAELFTLKRTWGVSLQALLVRAHQLGRINERAYQNAFRDLSRRGWRKSEPVNLGPPENPQLLERAFALAFKQGVTARTVFRELTFPERYIEDLAGAGIDGSAADIVSLPR